MDIVEFREYCLSLPDVEETLPFDDSTLVYKVGGRMFAMLMLEKPDHFVVKCDPERAIILRDRYPQITAAWHMNKRHWNDVRFEGRLSDEALRRELRHSYMLVVRQNVTPKALREQILADIATEGVVDDAERFV
ncbi:MAG: MmcQ/YjbR family DNA-binding protein [Rikenellaceae bacterium]|nr:MmcQ/YjbR family DNA-binding protein [Rikenellaceae bacterium]